MTEVVEQKKLKGTIAFDITSVVEHVKTSEGALLDAKDYVIDSENMLCLATTDLQKVMGLKKVVEAERVSKVKPLNDEVKSINAEYKVPLDFLDQSETVLKGAIGTYQQEQRRIAMEAQRQADEKARQERIEFERKAREAREAAAKLEEEARAAVESGDESAAAAIAEQAAAVADQAESMALAAEVVSSAPVVAVPKRISGISTRTIYSAAVSDFKALVDAVSAGKAPIECLSANTTFLGAQARAFKKPGELYPGVRVTAEQSIAARSA